MAHVSLYRRYRPVSFDTVIGQNHIIKTLKNSVLSGNISHAYLFTGTRGTGKTSTAKIFARAINCLNPQKDGSPCNECSVCQQLLMPNNMDVLEIDAASNNGVDEIRDLREKIKYPPTVGKYKVYIIDEAHMLSLAAFNALLKTLEEPPKHAVLILATTEVHKIPQTILSRCMRFDFRLLPTPQLAELVKKIFLDIKRDYEDEAIQLIAESGDGSVRDTLSVADMCVSFCDSTIKYDDVLEVLGACSPKIVAKLVEQILESDIRNALEQTSQILSLGKSVEILAKDIAKAMRNVLYCKNCSNANALLCLPKEIFAYYQAIASNSDNNRIMRAVEIFVNIENSLRFTNNPKIILEMSVVKACEITASIDTDGILQRLKEVESKVRESILNGKVTNTLNVNDVWGYLLNQLRSRTDISGGYAYAAKIDENNVKIDKNMLIILAKNQGEASGLNYYLKDIKNIIEHRYFELTDVQIIVDQKEDEISQGIEQIKNLFGDTKVEIK